MKTTCRQQMHSVPSRAARTLNNSPLHDCCYDCGLHAGPSKPRQGAASNSARCCCCCCCRWPLRDCHCRLQRKLHRLFQRQSSTLRPLLRRAMGTALAAATVQLLWRACCGLARSHPNWQQSLGLKRQRRQQWRRQRQRPALGCPSFQSTRCESRLVRLRHCRERCCSSAAQQRTTNRQQQQRGGLQERQRQQQSFCRCWFCCWDQPRVRG